MGNSKARVTLHRDVITGQFVKPAEVLRRPSQTVTERYPTGSSGLQRLEIHRNAQSGHFVSKEDVLRRPSVTVTEHYPKKKR